jgi:two-component system, chemotaxis family, response regulator Rcp1
MEVLLVEDSPGDVRLMLEAFHDTNPSIGLHVALDGVEAMAFVRREGIYAQAPRPDLVLLDLNLPKMDGRQVLADIKKDITLKLIPTVILTTSEAEMDIETCFDLGANSYLCKPVDLGTFEGLVRSLNDFWLTKSISPDHYMVLGRETRSVRSSTSISAACRKCGMTMGLGAIRLHPFAAHMASHTFLCTACGQTQSYMLLA